MGGTECLGHSQAYSTQGSSEMFHADYPMKSLSLPTKLFLSMMCLLGTAVFLSGLSEIEPMDSGLLVVLCILASLALVLKVKGASKRSYYTFSYVVYGFTFTAYGTGAALFVILVSHLVECIWYGSRWKAHLYKMIAHLVTTVVAGGVYLAISQGSTLSAGWEVAGIAMAMAVFTMLNHLMMGIFIWLKHRENLKKSRTFEPFPLILDISLLYLGAAVAIVWEYDPYAIALFIFPAYLLYSALRVPALERMTELDSKTGLFNHTYFKKQLESELARSNRFDRPLSVIIADLDLLRNINNTYGHLAGDEVLIGVANAMKQSVREYDVVSRFGGEEFAILLPETSLMQAYEKAEFFRKKIEKMEFIVPTSRTPIRATMSFGVAHRENSRQTSSEIVHNADLALYNSKLSGRNCTFAHTNNPYLDVPAVRDEHPAVANSISPGPFTLGTFMQSQSK